MFERIEQLMRENNVSAYKLSKETGIAQSTLSSWKNQNKIPRVDLLQKIAGLFHHVKMKGIKNNFIGV